MALKNSECDLQYWELPKPSLSMDSRLSVAWVFSKVRKWWNLGVKFCSIYRIVSKCYQSYALLIRACDWASLDIRILLSQHLSFNFWNFKAVPYFCLQRWAPRHLAEWKKALWRSWMAFSRTFWRFVEQIGRGIWRRANQVRSHNRHFQIPGSLHHQIWQR